MKNYMTIAKLLKEISSPNREACLKLLSENEEAAEIQSKYEDLRTYCNELEYQLEKSVKEINILNKQLEKQGRASLAENKDEN